MVRGETIWTGAAIGTGVAVGRGVGAGIAAGTGVFVGVGMAADPVDRAAETAASTVASRSGVGVGPAEPLSEAQAMDSKRARGKASVTSNLIARKGVSSTGGESPAHFTTYTGGIIIRQVVLFPLSGE